MLSRSHEEMSVKMIDYIVEENNIDIDPAELKRVQVSLFCHYHYLVNRIAL